MNRNTANQRLNDAQADSGPAHNDQEAGKVSLTKGAFIIQQLGSDWKAPARRTSCTPCRMPKEPRYEIRTISLLVQF
jgi:hypothetical protein